MTARRVSVALILLFFAVGTAGAQPLQPPPQPLDTVYQFIISTYPLAQDGAAEIRLLTTDSAPEQVFTVESDSDALLSYAAPSFSALGLPAVFTAEGRGLARQLYLISESGSISVLIDDPLHHYDDPVWSPDDTTIVFQASLGDAEDATADLYSIHHDTGDIVQLTDTPELHEFAPTWSPDSQSLAYFTATDDGEIALMTLMLADGTPFRVLEPETLPGSIAWSPDGRLFFTAQTTDDIGMAIFAVAAEGGVVEELYLPDDDSGASIDHINLAPDGERLAFIASALVFTAGGAQMKTDIRILDIPTGAILLPPLNIPDGQLITGFDWR